MSPQTRESLWRLSLITLCHDTEVPTRVHQLCTRARNMSCLEYEPSSQNRPTGPRARGSLPHSLPHHPHSLCIVCPERPSLLCWMFVGECVPPRPSGEHRRRPRAGTQSDYPPSGTQATAPIAGSLIPGVARDPLHRWRCREVLSDAEWAAKRPRLRRPGVAGVSPGAGVTPHAPSLSSATTPPRMHRIPSELRS